MKRLIRATCLFALGSNLALRAQQPGPLPPSLDPEIWGCRAHPYIATLEVKNTPTDNGSQPDQSHPRQLKVYRDSSGHLRTEAFYDNGSPMTVLLKGPTDPTVIMLKVAGKTGFELPEPPPDRSRASNIWTVSTLPKRDILGLEAVGFRYVRTVSPKPESSGAAVTVVEEDWFSPAACMVLERYVTNSTGSSQDERVVSLERHEPDPSLFEIPPQYVMHRPGAQ